MYLESKGGLIFGRIFELVWRGLYSGELAFGRAYIQDFTVYTIFVQALGQGWVIAGAGG